MDTLKDDLERAVPHVDPGPDRADELVGAGRRAVRRRRAAAVGALAGAGLVAASVATGIAGVTPRDDRREASDPAAIAASPSRPESREPARLRQTPLTLQSLLEVAGRCPGRGGEPERVEALVVEDAYEAVEFECGGGSVRVVRTAEGEEVGRFRTEPGRTLREWAEGKVG